jgi:hypothetical protein
MNRYIVQKLKNRKIETIEDKDVTYEIVNKYFNNNTGFGVNKKIAINLLQLVINILNEFNIPYCLISGTLLGYMRHNDFIPWDDDIDLLVDSIIIKKMKDIIKKYDNILNFNENSTTIFVYFKDKIDGYNWPVIDLFKFTYDSPQTINFFGKSWIKNNFFPVNTVLFLNINAAIPNNPTYFLDINYSNDSLTMLVSNKYIHKTMKFVKEKIIKISLKRYNEIPSNTLV